MRVKIRVDDFDTILSILWLGEVSEVEEITVPNFTFYNELFLHFYCGRLIELFIPL